MKIFVVIIMMIASIVLAVQEDQEIHAVAVGMEIVAAL
jgi:hypothetical protein